MSLIQPVQAAAVVNVPRASGDEPSVIIEVNSETVCSPRERG